MATSKNIKSLTSEQQEIVGEMVHQSLKKAVGAMEQMLRIRVKEPLVSYNLGDLDPITELDLLGRFKAHLVKLIFSGDINGAFYFIIMDHEVELINEVCLPDEFKSEKRTETKMMKHGFMSEIENVITALAIKEISEYLGAQLNLQVPQIQIIPCHEINAYFEQENETYKTSFHVKSVLEGKSVNVAPFFIWIMDDNFLKILRLNTSDA